LPANFNDPLRNGTTEDDLRITAALPTIRYLLERETRVICCSHLGRPKGKRDAKYSLAPVAQRLSELLGNDVPLSPDVVGFEAVRLSECMRPGDVIMLENLRFDPGEEANDPAF